MEKVEVVCDLTHIEDLGRIQAAGGNQRTVYHIETTTTTSR